MTITKEGALASFYTMNKAPIKHLRVYFSPKQAGSGDASPENVREISGWDGVDVYHTKTNLFSYDVSYKEPSNITLQDTNNRVFTPYTYAYGASWSNWWQPNQVISCTVNRNEIKITTNRADYGVGFAISVKSGKTLHMSYINKNNIGRTYLAFYDENGKYITGGQYESNQLRTIPEDAVIVILIFSSNNKEEAVFTDVSVTYEDTFSYEPYSGQTHTIDWSNNIGTIPGGYVDLITGELVENETVITITDAEDFIKQSRRESAGGIYFMKERITPNCLSMQESNAIQVEKYSHGTIANPWAHNKNAAYAFSTNSGCTIRLGFADDMNIAELTDLDTWIKAQGGVSICYPLATPIIHTLTSTQLSTLIGRNNIWSNADRVEVEYDLAESNDELYRRRNILLRSAPHIETASGNPVTFSTDMQKLLKGLTIPFTPIQASGTPSPENPLLISGITGLTVYHSGADTNNPTTIPITFPALGKNLVNTIQSGIRYKSSNYFTYSFEKQTITFNITTAASNFILLDVCRITSDMVGKKYVFSMSSSWGNNSYSKLVYCNDDGSGRTDVTGGIITQAMTGKMLTVRVYPPVETGEFTVSSIQVEQADSPTTYEPFTNTCYGGELDLATGELVEEWSLFEPNANSDISILTGGTYRQFRFWDAEAVETRLNAYCSHFTMESNPNMTGKTGLDYLDTACQLIIQNDSPVYVETLNEFKAWLTQQQQNRTSLQIVFKRKNPIHHQLTPTQLKTLIGPNNIWTNSNGPVEIKYWTH